MFRIAVIAALVIGMALLVVRCSTPAATLRFRMTLEVSTPTGVKRGSSVQELVLSRPFLIPMPGAGGADRGGGFQIFGEAPFVELGDGRILFTKRRGPDYRYPIEDAVYDGLKLFEVRRRFPKDSNARAIRALDEAKTVGIVTPGRYPGKYPAFATFTSLNDPASGIEIVPDQVSVNLGAGYALERISVQVVAKDEPLTTLLQRRFPALAKERGLLALWPKK